MQARKLSSVSGQTRIGTRPILGFRLARVCVADLEDCVKGTLASPVAQYVWRAERNVSYCDPMGRSKVATGSGAQEEHDSPHKAPASGCGCGFYAWHTLDALFRPLGYFPAARWSFRRHWRFPHRRDWMMLTGVAGTGTVRIHEKGWRAEFADIVGLSDEVLGFPFPDPPVGRPKPQKAIDGALAHVVGDKYQVPVLPLARLQELMHGLGDFAPTFPRSEEVDLGREISTVRI